MQDAASTSWPRHSGENHNMTTPPGLQAAVALSGQQGTATPCFEIMKLFSPCLSPHRSTICSGGDRVVWRLPYPRAESSHSSAASRHADYEKERKKKERKKKEERNEATWLAGSLDVESFAVLIPAEYTPKLHRLGSNGNPQPIATAHGSHGATRNRGCVVLWDYVRTCMGDSSDRVTGAHLHPRDVRNALQPCSQIQDPPAEIVWRSKSLKHAYSIKAILPIPMRLPFKSARKLLLSGASPRESS